MRSRIGAYVSTRVAYYELYNTRCQRQNGWGLTYLSFHVSTVHTSAMPQCNNKKASSRLKLSSTGQSYKATTVTISRRAGA